MSYRPALTCPPWCALRHEPRDDISCHHMVSRDIGDGTDGWVTLCMHDWADSILSSSNGQMSIMVHWRATGKTASHPLDKVEKFAELAEVLGRDDVATLIREFAELASGGAR